jgi:hypothetical protein
VAVVGQLGLLLVLHHRRERVGRRELRHARRPTHRVLAVPLPLPHHLRSRSFAGGVLNCYPFRARQEKGRVQSTSLAPLTCDNKTELANAKVRSWCCEEHTRRRRPWKCRHELSVSLSCGVEDRRGDDGEETTDGGVVGFGCGREGEGRGRG